MGSRGRSPGKFFGIFGLLGAILDGSGETFRGFWQSRKKIGNFLRNLKKVGIPTFVGILASLICVSVCGWGQWRQKFIEGSLNVYEIIKWHHSFVHTIEVHTNYKQDGSFRFGSNGLKSDFNITQFSKHSLPQDNRFLKNWRKGYFVKIFVFSVPHTSMNHQNSRI